MTILSSVLKSVNYHAKLIIEVDSYSQLELHLLGSDLRWPHYLL